MRTITATDSSGVTRSYSGEFQTCGLFDEYGSDTISIPINGSVLQTFVYLVENGPTILYDPNCPYDVYGNSFPCPLIEHVNTNKNFDFYWKTLSSLNPKELYYLTVLSDYLEAHAFSQMCIAYIASEAKTMVPISKRNDFLCPFGYVVPHDGRGKIIPKPPPRSWHWSL